MKRWRMNLVPCRQLGLLILITCGLAVNVPEFTLSGTFMVLQSVTPSSVSTEGTQSAQLEADQPAFPTKAYLIVADGTVNQRMVRHFREGLIRADTAGAQVVIVVINTFGGDLDAAVAIRDNLLDVHLRTIAFVNKRAISAGALIALATHDIVMVPGATIGAATPLKVTWRGFEPAGEKTISYFRKEMKATAESRAHPGELAEAMVDSDVVLPGVVEKDKLLTLTTQEALTLQLAAAQSENLEQLLQTYNLELLAESQKEATRLTAPFDESRLLGQWRAWQVWFVLGLLLALAEILIPGFFILWFGVGALLASFLAFLGVTQTVQVSAFLASSFILLVFSRTIFSNILFSSRESLPMNIEALKGRTVMVLEAIDGSLKPGLVKIGGEVWSAICDEETRLTKGAKVEVLEIVGNRVRVKPV